MEGPGGRVGSMMLVRVHGETTSWGWLRLSAGKTMAYEKVLEMVNGPYKLELPSFLMASWFLFHF